MKGSRALFRVLTPKRWELLERAAMRPTPRDTVARTRKKGVVVKERVCWKLTRQLPATVDVRPPGKVQGNRLPGDVLDVDPGRGNPQLEMLAVGREQQHAIGAQKLERILYQRLVIALDVEGCGHALRVGEGRRVEEDETVTRFALVCLLYPFQTVCLNKRMRTRIDSIQGEITPRPLEVGMRKIDGRRARGVPQRCIHAGSARISEQVQKMPPGRQGLDEGARAAMIEKQAGVDIVGEIHREAITTLFDGHEASFLGELGILRPVFLSLA